MVVHPIDPVFNEHSRVLILGSFPSVKSREAEFFYGHVTNQMQEASAVRMEAYIKGILNL